MRPQAIDLTPKQCIGNRQLFSGTFSPGTQAAGEFFASAKLLGELRRLFRKEGRAGFPAAYQVVVKAHVSGTSALDVQYAAHRVIAN